MDDVLKEYLTSLKTDAEGRATEMEVRFTNNNGPLSKTDYDNIMKRLVRGGFRAKHDDGLHSLRITTMVGNARTAVRTEIDGLDAIQSYCQTNKINDSARFIQKTKVQRASNDKYPFSINLSHENKASKAIQEQTEAEWVTARKTFRYMNRIQLVHDDYPVFVDCSVVRSSKIDKKGTMQPMIDIAGSLKNYDSYEVEIEIDNAQFKDPTPDDFTRLKNKLSKCIQVVLCGIQHTNYPISYDVTKDVFKQYFKLIKKNLNEKPLSEDFIGPSSVTLQHDHVPLISVDYSVTDKADGLRKLLFIDNQGHVYFITSSMEVEYTNIQCPNKACHNTIIDGEHITTDINDKPINLYACFDIYVNHNVDCRADKFITENNEPKEPCRLDKLKTMVLAMGSLSEKMAVKVKTFIHTEEGFTIHEACASVLENPLTKNYHTDGLIFTPMNFGVGMTNKTKAVPNHKVTWNLSFKWKPPDQNTIDFFVTTKKNETGGDLVTDLYDANGIQKKYKTLLLQVGMTPVLDPCSSVLNNKKYKDLQRGDYKRVKFFPTNPSDERAHICNRLLHGDKLLTEETNPESFEDKMVVEFRYDETNDRDWNWVPIRVRWDKTAEFRNGEKKYGNDYKTANNNWHSIHYPIKEKDLTEGEVKDPNPDAYYLEHVVDKKTIPMRKFHNYIKRSLIKTAAKDGSTLIDFAVGKAGDLHKWSASNIAFVVGFDKSKDCIENAFDGACIRYMEYKKNHPDKMKAVFFQGDSSQNIKSGDIGLGNKESHVIKSIFGQGKSDSPYQNIIKEGFDISSAQFSLHYFFKDAATLSGLIKNITQCTKKGGHFIGTCFDGARIFKLLADKRSVVFGDGFENRICEIEKMYEKESFPDDESSVGYEINVFNQTIGKFIPEYLVNFQFFVLQMRRHGFELHSPSSSSWTSTPSTTFEKVFINEKRRFADMTAEEKRLSFLNIYFMFEKKTDGEVPDLPKVYPIEKLREKILIQKTT